MSYSRIPDRGPMADSNSRHDFDLTLDGKIQILDAQGVSRRHVIHTEMGRGVKINRIAFSPDGKTLFFGTSHNKGGTLVAWDLTENRQINSVNNGYSFLMEMELSPDGQVLATVGLDRTIKLWSVRELVHFETGD